MTTGYVMVPQQRDRIDLFIEIHTVHDTQERAGFGKAEQLFEFINHSDSVTIKSLGCTIKCKGVIDVNLPWLMTFINNDWWLRIVRSRVNHGR